ncbi:MAG: hypothetical protein ACJ72S_03200 [Nitrososphaeraceae archaeon]
MSVRRQQGELIAQIKGSIKKFDNRKYVVNSQSGIILIKIILLS